MVNREDAKAPTKLFVSYKGWWRLPLLRVPLALAPLDDGVSATRKDGKVTLIQRFESGRAPTLRVAGRSSQLVLELCAGLRLRTRAVVRVGDLVSATAPGVVEVPFQVKVGGKVEDAFVTVAQVSPVPTPAPPSVCSAGHRRAPSPAPRVIFPLGEYQPSAARLQHLVQEMHGYGPMPDPAEWLLPCGSAPRVRHSEAASMPPAQQCEPAAAQEAEEAEDSGAEQDAQTNTTRDSEAVSATQQDAESSEAAGRTRQEDQQLHHSPQRSPLEVGASYVRLWKAVFGNPDATTRCLRHTPALHARLHAAMSLLSPEPPRAPAPGPARVAWARALAAIRERLLLKADTGGTRHWRGCSMPCCTAASRAGFCTTAARRGVRRADQQEQRPSRRTAHGRKNVKHVRDKDSSGVPAQYSPLTLLARFLTWLSRLCTAWQSRTRRSIAHLPERVTTLLHHLTAAQLATKLTTDNHSKDDQCDWSAKQAESASHHGGAAEADWLPQQAVAGSHHGSPGEADWSLLEDQFCHLKNKGLCSALQGVACVPQPLSAPREVTSVHDEQVAASESVLLSTDTVAPHADQDDEEYLWRHVPFLTEAQLRSLGRGRLLGVGGFGCVRQLQYEGRQAIVKLLLRADDLASLLREARVLAELSGAGGAPRLLAVCRSPPALVQQFLGHTYDYYLGGCSVEQFLKSLIDICQRLEEVHQAGYVHNDIKFNNITFTGTISEPHFHIIDFGLACHVGDIMFERASDLTDREARAARRRARHAMPGDTIEHFLSSFAGTAAAHQSEDRDAHHSDDCSEERTPWMAPEVLAGQPVLPPGDVYSVGYLMQLMMHGSPLTFLARPLRRLSHLCTAWQPTARPSLPQLAAALTALLQHFTAAQLATTFDTDNDTKHDETHSPAKQAETGSHHGDAEHADWSPQQAESGSHHGDAEEGDWSPQVAVDDSHHGDAEHEDWSLLEDKFHRLKNSFAKIDKQYSV